MTHPLLAVRDLSVRVKGRSEQTTLVAGLSFDVATGETLAIVGESGSGKTTTCRSLLKLVPPETNVTGSVLYNGIDLLQLSEPELRRYRGREIGIVFQDAERALNPTMQIGRHICEAIHAHMPLSRTAAQDRASDLLSLLKVPTPHKILDSYPHELSGGMRQRAMIAAAIAAGPKVLIADEPTASLDAYTAAQTMELLKDLQNDLGMALVLVTHDRRLVRDSANSVLVMQSGRSVEYASAATVMTRPRTKYTETLLVDVPQDRPSSASPEATDPYEDRVTVAGGDPAVPEIPLLKLRNLVQEFRLRAGNGRIRPVDGVSLSVRRGEVLGVVGETGAGKSCLASAIMQAPPPSGGAVFFRGHDLTRMRGRRLSRHRSRMQIVFQDPYASLDPTWRVFDLVAEPLLGAAYDSQDARQRRIEELLDVVGMPASIYGHRRPGELSGGQCQRVAIARALAPEPELIICDEAVSSLDVVVQKQLVELFRHLRARLGLALLFIAHDLKIVDELCSRTAVMYQGRLCEVGPTQVIGREPYHPYTEALVGATRRHGQSLCDNVDPPSQFDSSTGCRFRHRCKRAAKICAIEEPQLRDVAENHVVACHFPLREALAIR